jgi:predicted PurR-regulated permease PerM
MIGTLTGVLLFVVRFPYPFLLGALAGVMGLIPFLGLVLSLIPAVIIALVSGSVLLSLVKVAGVYGVVQILDGGVISPRIVGDSVGLHPVWIVLALSMGGFFFGFVGLLIGVPVAVGVKLAAVRGLERYRASKLYEGAEDPPHD